MQITLKLFASLGRYLPAGAHDNAVRLEVEPGATPRLLIHHISLPPDLCHLVMVNGRHVQHGAVLEEGDVVAIWPPVAGG